MRLAFFAIVLLFIPTQMMAQEFGDYGYLHEQFHNFYQQGEKGKPIMRPHQPSIACCNGDCRPTRSRKMPNGWLVWIDRQWHAVPEERIKRNIKSPNGTAHVCANKTSKEIYCFVPPELEM